MHRHPCREGCDFESKEWTSYSSSVLGGEALVLTSFAPSTIRGRAPSVRRRRRDYRGGHVGGVFSVDVPKGSGPDPLWFKTRSLMRSELNMSGRISFHSKTRR